MGRKIAEEIPPRKIYNPGIVFSPSSPGIIYPATEGYQVDKSTDNGLTFSLIANLRDDLLNQ